jgi:pyridoxamine 5'-phosphate oxidase
MNELDLAALRQEYAAAELNEADAPLEPWPLFARWLHEAVTAEVVEPNAMTLATVDEHGRPDARVVLLKGWDPRGLVFFSNYRSAKGQALARHPEAALVLWWGPLERQVRARGPVTRVSSEESDAYFASRPEGSRFGAAASPQSEVVADRAVLAAALERLRAAHPSGDVPRPEHWGGYRVAVRELEFWQGRRSRLHDRLRYRAQPNGGGWTRERLAP